LRRSDGYVSSRQRILYRSSDDTSHISEDTNHLEIILSPVTPVQPHGAILEVSSMCTNKEGLIHNL
jgi:hypothetical protein